MQVTLLLGCLIISTHAFTLLRTKALSLDEIRFNSTYRVDTTTNQFYSKHYRKLSAAKPGDVQYSLKDRTGEVFATLRLCCQNVHGWALLRSVCVAKEHRRQGLGLDLLELALNAHVKYHDNAAVYCFAETHLTPLYLKCGFQNSLSGFPKDMIHHFEKLKRRVTADNEGLECFQWSPLHVLLLQHDKEIFRKTGTGKLLYGSRHLNVRNLTWGGRANNKDVQTHLQEAQDENHVILWTGCSATTNASAYHPANSTFILLDGTWQEAQSMFRKIPELQQLPRLALRASTASNYTLRQDFGWRDRFSSENSETLLCTAEVGAELLDQVASNAIGACMLRERLHGLQRGT